MISVIICHVNKELLAQVEKNIRETIGVPHELIVIDNSSNRYNIFQAYNEGVKRSRFPFLCFVHEDVLFHTQDWGKNAIQHFADTTVGMIGTIGGTAFPNCPAPWWNDTTLNKPHLNLIQHWHDLKPPPGWTKEIINSNKNIIYQYLNPANKPVVDAVALDGVFFCARKEMFEKHLWFDEKTFDKFHCYDTDICFQTLKAGYRVVIVFDILLEHFSVGSINAAWLDSVERLADKWQNDLPLFAGEVDDSDLKGIYQYKTLLTFCYRAKEKGYDDKRIQGIIKKYFRRIAPARKCKQSLLLWLWMKLGYKRTKYPYFILKQLYK